MAAPYIPARDADFDAWLTNFSTLITASPVSYGLVAGDAVIIAGEQAAYAAALATATNPATRTAPTIAAKDNARTSAQAVVRPYAIRIRDNASVTDLQREALGLTVPKTVPTPIPAPTTSPALILVRATPLVHVLQFRDSETPLVKAKPFGVTACQIFRAIGVAPAVDPSAASFLGAFGKTPLQAAFSAPDVGKTATYFARWANRSGPAGVAAVGPWSAPLSAVVL